MKALKIIPLILLSLLIISCKKENIQSSGIGDVLIISKKSGNDYVFGLSLYAYTFSSFKSITATNTAEPGKTYTLNSNQGYKTSFLYETPDTAYRTTKPLSGTFNFSAIFENGVTQEFQNVLSDKVLSPAIIDTCKYNSTKHLLRLTWKPVTDAESYAINIMNGSTLAYSSPLLPTSQNAVWISSSLNGWTSGNSPVSGKTYKVVVFSYLYEPVKTSYNIQCVSVAESETVWGN